MRVKAKSVDRPRQLLRQQVIDHSMTRYQGLAFKVVGNHHELEMTFAVSRHVVSMALVDDVEMNGRERVDQGVVDGLCD